MIMIGIGREFGFDGQHFVIDCVDGPGDIFAESDGDIGRVAFRLRDRGRSLAQRIVADPAQKQRQHDGPERQDTAAQCREGHRNHCFTEDKSLPRRSNTGWAHAAPGPEPA